MAANGLHLSPPLLRFPTLIKGLSGLLLVAVSHVSAREYYFSPSALEGDELSQQDIDLSLSFPKQMAS